MKLLTSLVLSLALLLGIGTADAQRGYSHPFRGPAVHRGFEYRTYGPRYYPHVRIGSYYGFYVGPGYVDCGYNYYFSNGYCYAYGPAVPYGYAPYPTVSLGIRIR